MRVFLTGLSLACSRPLLPLGDNFSIIKKLRGLLSGLSIPKYQFVMNISSAPSLSIPESLNTNSDQTKNLHSPVGSDLTWQVISSPPHTVPLKSRSRLEIVIAPLGHEDQELFFVTICTLRTCSPVWKSYVNSSVPSAKP